MGACTKISFLSNGCGFLHGNFTQGINANPLAQASSIQEGEMPGYLNADGRMDKRNSGDFCSKGFKDEEAPLIQEFRIPRAQKKPTDSPNGQDDLRPKRPRILVGIFLMLRFQEINFNISFVVRATPSKKGFLFFLMKAIKC